MERLFNKKSWVLLASEVTVLLIDVAIEVEMGLISHDDFSMKLGIISPRHSHDVVNDRAVRVLGLTKPYIP